MPIRSDVIQRWWPTTQSLDLVLGATDAVAAAAEAEIRRFVDGARVVASWERFPDLESAFRAAPHFTNSPSVFLVLPTRSPWTVLWNNSFLCDGYDSLCWNLTTRHGFRTLHWEAHDEQTTMQPGASFTHRAMRDDALIERSVYAAQEDTRWLFHAVGEPLPEEDQAAYAARRKRDRLNESAMVQLLARLGAHPWAEDFYALGDGACRVIRIVDPGYLRRSAAEVLHRSGARS